MFQKLSIFAAFKSTLEFANAIMVTRQVSLYSCLDPLGHALFINVVRVGKGERNTTMH